MFNTTIASFQRHDIPLCTDSLAWYPWSTKIAAQFEFHSKYAEDGDEPVRLWRRAHNMIGVPRECCPVGSIDDRRAGEPISLPTSPTPRPYQKKVFNEALHFLQDGKSGIVVAHTGWGKTPLGVWLIARLAVKTLIIVTKDDIFKQWIAALHTLGGLPQASIGEIRANACYVVGTSVCVAMIHSLSRPSKYDEVLSYFDEFGLVIFDEVHRLPADQFQACASMFKAKLRLGLSANFQRKDGKELTILANIGPVRVKTTEELMVPKVMMIPTGWRCPRMQKLDKNGKAMLDDDGRQVLVTIPHGQKGRTSRIEKVLLGDDERTGLIGWWVAECHKKGRVIVVFSTLHLHLLALARAAKEHGVPKEAMAFYISATTKAEKEDRDRGLASASVILTTFGMMGEGTDADHLDTCVLAMPRADPQQPVGRIRRVKEGKREPLVIDFVDADSPVFSGYARAREKWYEKIGAKVLHSA